MSESAKESALDHLKVYLTTRRAENKIVGKYSEADRQVHSRIFELCVAYELGLTIWEELNPDAFDKCDELKRFNNGKKT